MKWALKRRFLFEYFSIPWQSIGYKLHIYNTSWDFDARLEVVSECMHTNAARQRMLLKKAGLPWEYYHHHSAHLNLAENPLGPFILTHHPEEDEVFLSRTLEEPHVLGLGHPDTGQSIL
jgi:hypothetical protein